MKVWRFYKKPETDIDKIPDSVSIIDKYPLYAITCEKKLAKRFMKERNMDKFILRTDNDAEKEEYSYFANSHRSTVLELHKLDTVDVNDKVISVEVLMTMNEYQYVEETMNVPLFDESWWYPMPMPNIFNKDIRKALRKLGYTQAYKLYLGTAEYGKKPLIPELINEEDDDYSAPPWMVDQLSYFISIFSDLFK